MSLLHALVLGLIPGLTEFLSVSSSGHLVLVPRLLGWDEHPLSFDVALHLGTTLTVLLYFRRDFVQLTSRALNDMAKHRPRWTSYSPLGRLALLIVRGCIPAVIVGGLFNTAGHSDGASNRASPDSGTPSPLCYHPRQPGYRRGLC
ncbi:MAG: hypothetical protein HYX51_03455 [Chloroflexi bacterium]|nr:hypothetical protein [Chloroflexota bacterium]